MDLMHRFKICTMDAGAAQVARAHHPQRRLSAPSPGELPARVAAVAEGDEAAAWPPQAVPRVGHSPFEGLTLEERQQSLALQGAGQALLNGDITAEEAAGDDEIAAAGSAAPSMAGKPSHDSAGSNGGHNPSAQRLAGTGKEGEGLAAGAAAEAQPGAKDEAEANEDR
jgi:hypothetical protein